MMLGPFLSLDAEVGNTILERHKLYNDDHAVLGLQQCVQRFNPH